MANYTRDKKVERGTLIIHDIVCCVDCFEGKVLFKVIQNEEFEDLLTIGEIVDKAIEKNKLDKDECCFLIICESALNGIIYRYNNHCENEILEVGELGGYA